MRYVAGEALRAGIGGALSLNLGNPPPAQEVGNRFDLDRFRDDTVSLRLGADALWRMRQPYLQGGLGVIFLAYDPALATLLRGASRAVWRSDRFMQVLVLGGRVSVEDDVVLGAHLSVILD